MAKMRSPNYPSIGLGEAVQAARDFWAAEKRTAVSEEVAAKALGYTSLSGPARSRLAALKKYGLLEGDGANIRLSDLAMKIVHPGNDGEMEESLREAALNPDLFEDLYKTHAGASDNALTSYLIRELQFSDIGARRVIGAFRDTIRVAKLGDKGYITSSETQESDPMPTEEHGHAPNPKTVNKPFDFSGFLNSGATNTAITRRYPLDISIPRGLKAELSIAGDFKQEDLERLKKQINRLVENLQDAFLD